MAFSVPHGGAIAGIAIGIEELVVAGEAVLQSRRRRLATLRDRLLSPVAEVLDERAARAAGAGSGNPACGRRLRE